MRLARALPAIVLIAVAVPVAGCGNTIQDRAVNDRVVHLATAVTQYPVYWAGRIFNGLKLTTLDRDPGGAFDIGYGDCVVGGQGVCVYPLLIVTSPDNSFIPGGNTTALRLTVRGLSVLSYEGGRVLELATGRVVVSIRAQTRALARLAVQALEPVNRPGHPYDLLPPPVATRVQGTSVAGTTG